MLGILQKLDALQALNAYLEGIEEVVVFSGFKWYLAAIQDFDGFV